MPSVVSVTMKASKLVDLATRTRQRRNSLGHFAVGSSSRDALPSSLPSGPSDPSPSTLHPLGAVMEVMSEPGTPVTGSPLVSSPGWHAESVETPLGPLGTSGLAGRVAPSGLNWQQ